MGPDTCRPRLERNGCVQMTDMPSTPLLCLPRRQVRCQLGSGCLLGCPGLRAHRGRSLNFEARTASTNAGRVGQSPRLLGMGRGVRLTVELRKNQRLPGGVAAVLGGGRLVCMAGGSPVPVLFFRQQRAMLRARGAGMQPAVSESPLLRGASPSSCKCDQTQKERGLQKGSQPVKPAL